MSTTSRAIKVTKSNALVEATYKLTLVEQRLILMAVSRIQPREEIAEARRFRITAKEYADAFGVSLKSAYQALEEAEKKLPERWISSIKEVDSRAGSVITERMRWVWNVKVTRAEGGSVTEIELSWSPEIHRHLSLLHERFTTYELHQVADLSSVYAIRLYEWLMQWRSTSALQISVLEFRARLELGSKYERFADLRKFVIEPSVEAINCHTSLEVSWEAARERRSITRLRFLSCEKQQQSLKLEKL